VIWSYLKWVRKPQYIFTVFPGSDRDIKGYLPGFLWWAIPVYYSARPIFAGVIKGSGMCGDGVIVVIPNPVSEFRDNSVLVEKIMNRLKSIQSFVGAKAISIAGQGPKFFKQNAKEQYAAPFVYGLKGRVFSVVETLQLIIDKYGLVKPNISIVGVGEIGHSIIEFLDRKGLYAEGIGFKVRTNGIGIELTDSSIEKIKNADIVLVQIPRGDDFAEYYELLKESAILVDDTHPRITSPPTTCKFYKVAIGKQDVEFSPPLPGYNSRWIPGCVQESMVASYTEQFEIDQDSFNEISKKLGFFAHLVQ
jgi:hypothetical protein